MFVEPLAVNRHVNFTDRRTKVDWAEAMRELVDVYYPEAEVIVVVLANLNTHSAASFYETFEPKEAHRLANRFEFHYTPKHGSWLNMAEIELSALGRQCLARRIPNKACLISGESAWEEECNASVGKVLWRFTTADSRIKLTHLYPRTQL